MKEPKWLGLRMALAIHAEASAMFGGLAGVRDQGLLESALDRPRNLLAYEPEAGLFSMAAALCHGIVKNHPFLDGNKRTGVLCTRAFLFLNGWDFEPEEPDEVETIVALAAGRLDQPMLAEWLEANSARLKKPNR
ncbi:MAG: type II toxin-antitoxin system death-on-curing family toxin [Alphaproteobacteria bacterium]